MATKRKAFSSRLLISTNGSSWAEVGNLKDFNAPDWTRETIDTTTHDNAEEWRSFLPGLKDGGTITAQLESDPDDAGLIALRGAFSDDSVRYFAILEPDGTLNGFETQTEDAMVHEFFGYVTKLSGGSLSVAGSILHDLEIKVTGKPVYTGV